MAVDYKKSQTDTISFWSDVLSILWFYSKIFTATVIFGSVFFFLFAGIKTGKIPFDIVAVSFASIVTVTILLVIHSVVNASDFLYKRRITREDDGRVKALESDYEEWHKIETKLKHLKSKSKAGGFGNKSSLTEQFRRVRADLKNDSDEQLAREIRRARENLARRLLLRSMYYMGLSTLVLILLKDLFTRIFVQNEAFFRKRD